MATTQATIKYIDETDRCYGLTGMAMGIVIWDREDLLTAINLDAGPDSMMEFSPYYYFAGNPRMSARFAWNQIVDHYRLSIGLLMANVLCRSYVHDRKQIGRETLDLIRGYVAEEGRATCSLDDDEIDAIFENTLNYLHRLFSHAGVQRVATEFATDLQRRRHMTVGEVIEGFRPLAML